MDKGKFEELVKQGIEVIPKRFLEKMNNVDIIVEDEPTEKQMEKLKLRKDTKLFGLYEGIPQTKRGFYAGVLPDKITIFQKSIEETCFNEEQIRERVRKTVWHEIAHHFGMNEEMVRGAEKRRNNN